MHHFGKKNSEIYLQRGLAKMFWGPTRMFPWAPLWLSTGLELVNTEALLAHICDEFDFCVACWPSS